MSSDEDNVSGKRKRRPRRLPDSPASTSSGSPIIGSSFAHSRRRRNLNTLQESSDSDTSANSDVVVKRRKVGKVETDSDFSSDSDSSPLVWRRSGRNLNRALSESSSSEESLSGSDIITSRRRRNVPLVLSEQDDDSDQWETDFTDSDDEPSTQELVKPSTSVPTEDKAFDSDSSDGISEKCAICLVSFKLQEVGIPENCEHTFCLECLEEWSKNMNTCPVDRIEYHSITVKKFLNGKVLRKIPIQRPERQEDAMDIIVEDPTYCEICHSDENEDRILLCDGCDLGYHLYCLNPPLEEVPEGNWYCVRCSPVINRNIDLDEVYALMREASDMLEMPGVRNGSGRRPSRRLIPRTRQSERVRQRVEHNRNRRRQAQPDDADAPSTSTGVRVSSNRVSSSSATTSRKKRKRPKARYKTVWVLNELGEAVATKKRVKGRKKRRSRKAPRRKKENLTPPIPDPRAGSSCASVAIKHHRHQGGVPSLDLFGSVNVLDFTESEDEGIFNETEARGINVALANRPSVVDGLRRTLRRKAAVQDVPTVSSSTDILDSIMQSQETLLSKNSVMSVVDSSGKIVIESKKKAPALNNNNPSKPDFNSYTVKEVPWHGRNYQQSGYRPHNRNNWSNRNNWQNQGNNYNNYHRPGGQNFHGQGGYGGQGRQQHYQDDIPQDYTQRTLCEAEQLQDEENEEEQQHEHQNQEENQLAENSTSEADVDIYGDIETEAVSTSNKTEEDYRPPSPQPMQQSHTPNTNTDEDCDSESGMVIDTERGLDEPVSSTVAIDSEPLVTYSPGQPTASPEDNPQYSPGEPTGSPTDAQETENSQNVSLDQLKSGFDELQREFASGLMEFQMNISGSNTNYHPESKQDVTTSSSVSQEIQQSENEDDKYQTENVENDQVEPELANIRENESEDVSPSQSPSYNSELKPSRLDSSPIQNDSNFTASVTENLLNLNSCAKHQEDDEMSDDGCPNFSIYSKQSKSVALTTDLTIRDDPISDNESTSQTVTVEKTGSDPRLSKVPTWNLGGLYSDSEDESVVKKTTSFGISDIKDMTEDILSEEERSYTPVLDERCEKPKKGVDGLDTEMISDDDRNDFDESHELKTASDGDALEINAKESELDFTRPDEFEEGEIVDKHKEKPPTEPEPVTEERVLDVEFSEKKTNKKDKEKGGEKEPSEKKKKKEKDPPKHSNQSIEESANKENVNKEAFKKLTKSSKDRNYRDKDREKAKDSRRSRSPETSSSKREEKRKKEKRKELARYNVRAIIAEKPRAPPKDQFGRDIIRRSGSRSRSRSYTPPLAQKSPIRAPSPSVIPRRHSPSPRVRTPPRGRSPVSKRRSSSRSREKSRKRKRRSPSGDAKRDRSKTKKRKRSTSRSNRGKKPKERGGKKRARRSLSHRRRSVSPRRRREWTPSLSRSLTPPLRHLSPSWTPPRAESNVLRNQNLTVIVNNDAGKKKKDKRNKEKRRKDEEEPPRRRRRERERTPPPSKEVFASGDNILVSVSFNNDSENRDVTRENRKRKEISAIEQQKKNERREKRNRNMVGVKPVAIIDLERSPFQEIVSSPKDVIVLSDSDNNETESNRNVDGTNGMCDSSQQVASPEQGINYSTGPKTPPEPSVKFALMPKPQQMRAINNPLHDPLEHVEEEEEDGQDDLNSSSHKGPNTPPEEPPTSPPSSPDAYDPFEPTKSRSPTPEPGEVPNTIGEEHNTQGDAEEVEKTGQTPDLTKSLTPPVPDIQPADSQSSIQEVSESKSPEDNRPNQPTVVTKPIAQTVPFSPAAQPALAAIIPVSSTVTISRINILSSAMLTPAATAPQRAAQVKPSPVKISPTKAPVKSTPIKPMQSKTAKKKQQNGNTAADETINLDFDSPYSPGSSDYEDLFEPPTEPTSKPKPAGAKSKSTGKKTQSSAFDTLFGSPTYNKKGGTKKSKRSAPSKTKHVGVKVDEDSLKILEDLPNSAVEMQVKDKFLKKLNRQERVVEEVKLVLKPFYNKKKITKEEYKDIMRRAVPKICHNKSGEINPIKIRSLIEAYVKKVKHSKKVTSSSQKVV